MKRYNPVYYLLFVMLIMGTFASMAQNAYGFKMIGFVAFAFAFLFGWQLIGHIKSNGPGDKLRAAEAICLMVLSAVLAMRVFYLRFPFVEALFAASGLVLILVYGYTLVATFRALNTNSKTVGWIVVVFHASIIFYLISLTAVPFLPVWADTAGGIGFTLLVIFLIAGFVNYRTSAMEDSAYKHVIRFKDRSVILLSLFALLTTFIVLTKTAALPQMYADEYPHAYYELVRKEGLGKDKASEKYTSEEFKEMYERFVRNNKPK